MALVLVVDDVQDGREILARLLHRIGSHEVITAADGPEALQLIRERQPDVVLLDIAMPEMDGFDMLTQLRCGRNNDTPVIMLSAMSDRTNRERAMKLGAVGYFVKGSLDIDQLLLAVDDAVGQDTLHLNR